MFHGKWVVKQASVELAHRSSDPVRPLSVFNSARIQPTMTIGQCSLDAQRAEVALRLAPNHFRILHLAHDRIITISVSKALQQLDADTSYSPLNVDVFALGRFGQHFVNMSSRARLLVEARQLEDPRFTTVRRISAKTRSRFVPILSFVHDCTDPYPTRSHKRVVAATVKSPTNKRNRRLIFDHRAVKNTFGHSGNHLPLGHH